MYYIKDILLVIHIYLKKIKNKKIVPFIFYINIKIQYIFYKNKIKIKKTRKGLFLNKNGNVYGFILDCRL